MELLSIFSRCPHTVLDALGNASEPEAEPALYKGLNVPDWADDKALPRGAAIGGKDTSAAKKGHEAVMSVPPAQQKSEAEGGKLPAVKKLPPWFREGFDPDSPEVPSCPLSYHRGCISLIVELR